MVDVTRLRKNAEKKQISVSSAEIRHTDVGSTALQELFKLPPNCLITNATCFVETAGQASLTVNFGFDGGTELGSALAISATGAKGTALAIASRIATGTGKLVTAVFSADPTAGVFHFIVEYIEYTRGNGEYTNFGSQG